MQGQRLQAVLSGVRLLAALLLAAALAAPLIIATWPPDAPAATQPAGLRLHAVSNVAALDAVLGLSGAQGLRIPVDRTSVRQLPSDWPEAAPQSHEKLRFVRVVLPLVLAANERIVRDRRRLQRLAAQGGAVNGRDRRWLQEIARRYGTPPAKLAALMRRVDAVPPSLALAQAIIESGWGRSRFARDGNALFGQWTWRQQGGLRPQQARADQGYYAVRAFPHLYAATVHYMVNLNRHPAYATFRRERARQRAAGTTPSGPALAPTLSAYSERGMENVRLIQTVIRQNRLAPLDRALLAPRP